MPECHRCRRVLASAEVRRTKLGWVCKGATDKWSRCAQIVKQRRADERAGRRAAA